MHTRYIPLEGCCRARTRAGGPNAHAHIDAGIFAISYAKMKLHYIRYCAICRVV